MIKKITAFSFLFLANIILLAHGVLPHHHHEQQVCFINTHCTGDAAIHNHNSTEHSHQHDGTDNANCILKQAVIIPSSQSRILKDCDNCIYTHSHDFFIFSNNFAFKDLQPSSLNELTVPKFSSFFISFVTPTLGLRAPPNWKNKC